MEASIRLARIRRHGESIQRSLRIMKRVHLRHSPTELALRGAGAVCIGAMCTALFCFTVDAVSSCIIWRSKMALYEGKSLMD